MKADPRRAWTLTLAVLLTLHILSTGYTVLLARSHADEGHYLMKSYWYVTGAVQPYGPEDHVWYMPVTFYVFGPWQRLFGIGHVSARIGNALITLLAV